MALSPCLQAPRAHRRLQAPRISSPAPPTGDRAGSSCLCSPGAHALHGRGNPSPSTLHHRGGWWRTWNLPGRRAWGAVRCSLPWPCPVGGHSSQQLPCLRRTPCTGAWDPPTRLPSSHPTIPWEPRARLPNRHPFPPPAIRPGGSGLGVGRQGPQGLETDSRRVRLPVQRPVQGDTCWADCVFPFNRLARPPLQNHCHAGSLLYGTAHVPLTCERLSPQPRPCRAVLFLG